MKDYPAICLAAALLLGCWTIAGCTRQRVGDSPAEDEQWAVSGYIDGHAVEVRSDGRLTELVSAYSVLALRRDVCAVTFTGDAVHTWEVSGQWQYRIRYSLDHAGEWDIAHTRATAVHQVDMPSRAETQAWLEAMLEDE